MRTGRLPRHLALWVMLGLAACATDEAPEREPVAEPAAAGSTAAPADTAAGATITVAQAQGLGEYIADANGRALYLLEGEPQGQSSCYDACAEEWPPLLAPRGAPTAGTPAVQAGLIGTLQRRDGSAQVTYGGHALYYYHDDEGPGQTMGQDVTDRWGEWYLVRPAGEPLEETS